MKKRKTEIGNILNEIGNLLRICEYVDQATWLEKRIRKIKSRNTTTTKYKKILKEISGIIAGMGSLSDMPLTPGKNTRLSREQARQMKWDLLEKLDESIEKALK